MITDQTVTSPDILAQLASSNCITPYATFGCSPAYYQQPVVFNPKELHIEAVDGGYIIRGRLGDNNAWRTVAVSSDGAAKLLLNWCTQWECKAKR